MNGSSSGRDGPLMPIYCALPSGAVEPARRGATTLGSGTRARVVVVGAGGYSGAELVSILLAHPGAEIVGVFGSAKRQGEPAPFSASWPRFRGRLDLPVKAMDIPSVAELRPDAVFLATPHEASIDLAPGLLERNLRVLDLSGALRLKNASLYPKYYGFEHHAPELLAHAVYGLPELHRDLLRNASLVAVPGCYPTSAILPLFPLVRAGAIRRDAAGRALRPIIDSTSGVSGAGRTPTQKSLFCEVSLQPYGVLSHRHNPEIDQYAGVATVFTPHLGCFERGILSTIHIELADGWNEARVRDLYTRTFASEPFVRVCEPGVWPAIADVTRTNFCDIGFAVDEAFGHMIAVSAIDNLVKGAAGQAVQCMNLALGIGETAGLLPDAHDGGHAR